MVKNYTDYKPNEQIFYYTYIPSKNQILILSSRSEGLPYDGNYDLGYPNNYVVSILKKNSFGWIQIYRSAILAMNNEEDEFGIEAYMDINTVDMEDIFEVRFLDYAKNIQSKILWDQQSVHYTEIQQE